ncbi:MAG: DUF2127 domain-containing protein [Planctomycetaceae bacterium]
MSERNATPGSGRTGALARGLRAVAIIEFAKSVAVLLAGCGLLALLHENVQALAEEIVGRLHLNPAKGYPRIFIDAAAALTDARLWLLAVGAFAYAACRAIEALGLWREREWAEWFGALTGAIYVPFEIYELTQGVNAIKRAALLVNVAVVAYLAYALRSRRTNAQRGSRNVEIPMSNQ